MKETFEKKIQGCIDKFRNALSLVGMMNAVAEKFDGKVLNARFTKAMSERMSSKGTWQDEGFGASSLGFVSVPEAKQPGQKTFGRLKLHGYFEGIGYTDIDYLDFEVDIDGNGNRRLNVEKFKEALEKWTESWKKTAEEYEKACSSRDEAFAEAEGILKQIQETFKEYPRTLWYEVRRKYFVNICI